MKCVPFMLIVIELKPDIFSNQVFHIAQKSTGQFILI